MTTLQTELRETMEALRTERVTQYKNKEQTLLREGEVRDVLDFVHNMAIVPTLGGR